MGSYLCLQLYGPLQAWGTVAVGEIRPVSARPTRSGVLGLVAAALKIPRGDEARLSALSEGLGFAVRVDAAGERFIDYHTVQTPKEKAKRLFYSRRDELGPMLDPFEELNTILSRREYQVDALFTICLWRRELGDAPSLEEIAQALKAPGFLPYMGRKSCPTALPFNPLIVEADDALAALDGYTLPGLTGIKQPWDKGDVFADEDYGQDDHLETLTQRDEMINFSRRQFGTRRECHVVRGVETGRDS